MCATRVETVISYKIKETEGVLRLDSQESNTGGYSQSLIVVRGSVYTGHKDEHAANRNANISSMGLPSLCIRDFGKWLASPVPSPQ